MTNDNELNLDDLVSIITPAYNSEKFIRHTIDSVLAQTYSNWEMIVVDDCSTDRTVEIVTEFMEKDNRIKLVQLKENKGPALTRNTAIKYARGRYLAFLDSDDQWLPEKLQRQLVFMKKNDIAFSYTNYEFIDEDGTPTNKFTQIPDVVDYKDLLKQNIIGCLTVMLDINKTGKIEMADIRSRQDYTTWLSLTKRGFKAYGIKETLAKYRLVENSLSSNKVKMAKQNWKVYREVERLSVIKSLWYFLHYIYYKVRKYLSRKKTK
ncbi:glycosyltransferase family 2 protein [Evansella clarkii]|uniref:glycosyltransferase family 2 protein n=1 Tax=Evansella clarkii TaxID=79879 RepID=UPI000B42ED21|nr:glycosyltransferase family 2 protein [Evansella clarkii]